MVMSAIRHCLDRGSYVYSHSREDGWSREQSNGQKKFWYASVILIGEVTVSLRTSNE
jgi:hypothetical protein